VGLDAVKLRATDPANTVFGIKRLIGQSFNSSATRLVNHSAPFKLKDMGAGEVAVSVNSGDYAASEIAAIILSYLKERAESRFGGKVSKAVLTVPVTATRAVRDSMIACGRMAGLEVIRIITEPHAGALSLGPKGISPAPLLVFDFGGGTFDAAVLKTSATGTTVLSSAGDEGLGGDDLDHALARWVADRVQSVFRKDIGHDVVQWDRLLRACELVKRALSRSMQARLFVPDAFSALNKSQNIDSTVERKHLIPIWSDLVERSISAATDAIEHAGVEPGKLGRVLLIGGTSFVPQVQEAVAKTFRVERVVSQDPQTAVAIGAAIVGTRPDLADGDTSTLAPKVSRRTG
jgi:molecular chaperone DnaK (HSP70)